MSRNGAPGDSWPNAAQAARIVGVAGTLILLVAVLLLANSAWTRFTTQATFDLLTYTFSVLAFLAAAAALLLAYVTYTWLTLRYRLDRNAVSVSWAGYDITIPLPLIESVEALEELTAERRAALVPLLRPTALLGAKSMVGGRPAKLLAPPLSQPLLLSTAERRYLIAPADHDAFKAELQKRRALGVTRELAEEEHRGWLPAHPFWHERAPRLLLLVAVVANLLLFGYLATVYARLPENLAMHWNPTGDPDRIGPPEEILRLPLIALGLLAANTLLALITHRRDRLAASFLYAGAVAVQIVFAAAVITLVTRAI